MIHQRCLSTKYGEGGTKALARCGNLNMLVRELARDAISATAKVRSHAESEL